MKIQKADLAQKINKLKSVVPKKTHTPVLQGILVKDGYVIANNLEMTVKAKLEGTEGEHFIIPAKAFDLICNLPDGEVQVVPGKNNTITIRAEKIRNTYSTMPPDEFPLNDMPETDGSEITIKSGTLLKSIKRVSYAIPSVSSSAAMTALCMEAAGGKLNFVGLDGHMLAWDKVDYDGEFQLLIPKNTADKLMTIGMTGDVSVRHNKLSAVFVTEEFEIYTRLLAGPYFKYMSMFRELPVYTRVERDVFLEAMVRAKMCTDENLPVRLALSGDSMDINIKDATADYQETIALLDEFPEDMTIGFNAKLLIETLKAFECSNVRIRLGGQKQPAIIEDEDGDFRAVVLPVIIK